jgi:hypothetical protein
MAHALPLGMVYCINVMFSIDLRDATPACRRAQRVSGLNLLINVVDTVKSRAHVWKNIHGSVRTGLLQICLCSMSCLAPEHPGMSTMLT